MIFVNLKGDLYAPIFPEILFAGRCPGGFLGSAPFCFGGKTGGDLFP